MNKLHSVAGVIALALALPLPVFAAESSSGKCDKIGTYRVGKTSFTRLPLESALDKILLNTPLKARVRDINGLNVTAEGVAGSLDVVLQKLSKEVGFSYTQEGCSLVVFSLPKSAPVDGFDFSYTIDDAASMGLIQAFDNGERTWFRFSRGIKDKPPTIFMTRNGKYKPVKAESDSPYLIVNGISSKFMLQSGEQTATALYTGTQHGIKKNTAIIGVVNPEDQNDVEKILRKWAEAADWDLSWEVADDRIEVSFGGNFGTEFKPAVQDMIAALGPMEKTIEPLFYDDNKLLRVVLKGAKR